MPRNDRGWDKGIRWAMHTSVDTDSFLGALTITDDDVQTALESIDSFLSVDIPNTYVRQDGTTPMKYLQITGDALLTTPAPGTLEFYNDRLYITNVGHQRAIDRTSGIITTSTTYANSAVENTLFTGQLDSDAMKAGNLLKVGATGILSTANASVTTIIRIYVGATLIGSNTQAGLTLTDEPWDSNTVLTIRSVGTSGKVACHTEFIIGGKSTSSTSSQSSTIQTINTTQQEDITVTAQFNSASPSSSIEIQQGYFEFKG